MAKWDVEAVLGRTFTIEVKYDAMEARTGNVAIEHYNTRACKPSGISATTSDVWAIVLQSPTTVWLARTSDLRHYFETVAGREIACGGDGNAAMRLYPRHELFDAIFHRADELAPWDMCSLLLNLLDVAQHSNTTLQ